MQISKNCKDCKFWKGETIFSQEQQKIEGYGRCKRYPPSSLQFKTFHYPITQHIITHYSEWCGEFQVRETIAKTID